MLRRLLHDPSARADLLLASGILALAAVVLHEAGKIPPPFFDPLGSAAVPRLLAGALILLAVLLVTGRVLRARASLGPPTVPSGPGTAPLTALGVVLVTIVYLATMQQGGLGFRDATVLLVLALGAILCRGQRRRLLQVAVLAVVVGIGFDLIFTRIFFVDLPQAGLL